MCALADEYPLLTHVRFTRAGCILQMYVLLKSDDKSKQAMASIVISAMTAGMTSATIAYDFDVDPLRRKETPEFYGYIPDGASRTVIFLCMIFNGMLLLLSRSFCMAMLMLVEKKYFIWYSACDMGFYILLKIVRGDFWYWFPATGSSGLFVSFLMRVVNKNLTDYTGIVHFRGAAELGGLFWTLNMFMAILTPFAAIKLYYAITKLQDYVLEERVAWALASSLSVSWILFFILFLMLMNKKYRWTFFTTETGNDWAMSFFLKGDTDAKRAKPLRLNENKWRKIRPQMKEFVLDNWEKWEEEQPDFFTEAFKKRVPDDMLPRAEMRKQKAAGGGQRRRSSLGELMGGSVRERRGSATVVPFNEGVDVVGNDDEGAVVVEPTIVRLLDEKEEMEEMDEAGNKRQQQQQQKSESKRYEDDGDFE